MYRLIIRAILVTVAVMLILILLFRSRLPFGKSNSSFACEPRFGISKIEFSQSGKKLSLERNGDTWTINGRSEARKTGVLFILRILKEIGIKSPVSSELFESEIVAKGIKPVKVRVYEKRKLVKSFLVYKTPSNLYGNIMKISERSKPFIVCVPGFDGDIGSAFTLSELFWEPYTVFNLLPSEIASISLENLSDTASSFLISERNNQFILSTLNSGLNGWDSTLVTRYISYFARIPFEKWELEMGSDEKKKIGSQLPAYRITVTTSSGLKTVLSLWKRMWEENGSMTIDSDRLLGKTQNNDEFFVMRYFDIDPILKKRSYFFGE
jgi:hypothetical protein